MNSPQSVAGMSMLDYHVLLSLADGPRYGYAVKDAVECESAGALSPRAGSLYRVLARLMSSGLVRETVPEREPSPHPGRARKYYALTEAGRRALGAEARRLKQAAALAEDRLGSVEGSS
jgi:DNA-binding PadR family transcriptional regulator